MAGCSKAATASSTASPSTASPSRSASSVIVSGGAIFTVCPHAPTGAKNSSPLWKQRSMTSTHTGNPVCCAAALASVKKIVAENLTANAARLGEVLGAGLRAIQQRHADVIGHYSCRGLVGGLQMTKPGKKEPNHDLAHDVIERCFHKGCCSSLRWAHGDRP